MTDGSTLVHRLALRLLAPVAWYPGAPAAEEMTLTVGRIPEGLPVDVPVPEGAQVLGGLVRGRQRVTIALDAPMGPQAVLEFYRAQLLASGWTESEHTMGFAHGGFAFSQGMPIGGEAAQTLFCASERGPALTVAAFVPGAGPEGGPPETGGSVGTSTVGGGNDRAVTGAPLTAVRLELQLGARHSPCAPRNRQRGAFGEWLPTLEAPPGARQMGGGAGGSPDRLSASASVETRWDLTALVKHYEAQLERAGWAHEDGAIAGRAAWSSWRIVHDDEPWRGLLYALDRPDAEGHFLVHLHAEWIEAAPGTSWGWGSETSVVIPR